MASDRLRWAWRATFLTLRAHVSINIVLATAGLAVVEPLWLGLHAKWTHELLINALVALGLAVAAAFTLAAFLFLWNLARAGDRLLIERLQPGPQAVAAEQGRVRQLRGWVGMIAEEVADVGQRLERMRANGRYWNPFRQDFALVRFPESGGLLATDQRTESAFRALGRLRREMEALTHLVRARWEEDMQGLVGLDPDDVVDEPELRAEDDLGSLENALRVATDELRNAMRRLDG